MDIGNVDSILNISLTWASSNLRLLYRRSTLLELIGIVTVRWVLFNESRRLFNDFIEIFNVSVLVGLWRRCLEEHVTEFAPLGTTLDSFGCLS